MKPVIGITCRLDDSALRVRQDYVSAVWNSGGLPVILPITEQALALTDIMDGLLLTGGGDIPPDYFREEAVVPSEIGTLEGRERIDFETALLKEALEKGMPILAVCYGMQLLNVVHGGTLYQDIGHQIADAPDHRKGMHEIEIIDPLSLDHRKQYTVNSSHHQAVKDVGEQMSVFALSRDGIIEGLYKRGYTFCVGVQWHPERIIYDPLSSWLFGSLVAIAANKRRSQKQLTIGQQG